MKHVSMKTLLRRSVLVAAMLALVAGSASAATYNLTAGVDSTVDYGSGTVEMWGYGLVDADVDGDGVFETTGSGLVTIPGPTIYVPAGQDLTINLTNTLGVATSIVVQGQPMKGAPVFVGGRVTAFTDQADPFTGTVSYTWTAAELRPGTYLYQSGSHPAQQVHMGLYGALVVDADSDGDLATLEAYPGVFYDRDIVVIYSEVDPDLHNHPMSKTANALNFKPKYFLVNGDPTGDTVLTGPDPAALNSRVLLRFVNAGLKSYSPTLLGEDLDWVAEDGNTYPHVRRSYGSPLAAGKTMDAIWIPGTFDRHALYDRRLHMSRDGSAGGGLRAFLDSADTNLPIANAGDDIPGVSPGVALGTEIILTGSATLGTGTYVGWDWTLVGFPAGSSAALVVDPDPSIVRITPDVAGTYTAQLVVTDDAGFSSSPDAVNIFTNLPPVAHAGADQAVDHNAVVNLDGSLSYDPDAGDAIESYQWVVTGPDGLPLAPLSGVLASFSATMLGDYTVDLTVNDGELDGMDTLMVTASVHVNQPPDAVEDFFTVEWKQGNQAYVPNVLPVLVNDSDSDGNLDPLSLVIVTEPINGASAVPGDDGAGNQVILYTPKNGYKGTDYFTYRICDDEGECSEARVLVNVVKQVSNAKQLQLK